jgi:hypothetical protein
MRMPLTAQLFEAIRGQIVKRQDCPATQESMEGHQLGVRFDLPAHGFAPGNHGEPTAPLLFDTDDRAADLRIAARLHARGQRLTARTGCVLEDRQMIGV